MAEPAPAAPQMPAGPVTLSSELSVACPHLNAPVYPALSRRLGEEGKLVLKVELDESGQVNIAQIVNSSGYKRLDEAAMAAVKTWRCNLTNAQWSAGSGYCPATLQLCIARRLIQWKKVSASRISSPNSMA